ncbi:MAG TPA: peptidase M49 [Candidatus Polarisedimenticolia bacterium]|nr:peptidase M49 [Candidatus Polarisedimenticolia bacterium]
MRAGHAISKKRTLRPAALALALLATACGRAGTGMMSHDTKSDDRPYLLETVGEFAVSRLYADGFEDLSPRERALAFYLSRASIAGRDIYYDQMGRDNLEVRDLLEEILTHPQSIRPGLLAPLHTYLKLFWINNGNHNDRTKRKFVPGFRFEELVEMARAAIGNGAHVRLAFRETLDAKLKRLRPVIFDPDVEPLVTCKSPPPGQDILGCSSVNYYDGVTLKDLAGFVEKYPLNSRLVRRDGHLVEEVYRTGRGELPAGRHATELKTVVGFLEKARRFAEPPQAEVLGYLVDFFATGDPEAFRRYNIAWVQHDFPIDTVNGFIETYKDPRSQKGAWEGLVYFVDHKMNRLQKALAAEAQYFEDRAPWADIYKRKGITPPVANAINILAANGDSGPMPPVGVNLPNEEVIRERYGNKSVSLINAMDAYRRASQAKVIEEFSLPEDRPLLERYGGDVHLLQTTMHEVLGHASGKVGAALKGDPADHLREYYSTLEEARAELVALHNFFDPKLVEIGAIPSPEAAEAAYRDYATDDLYLLRRVREGEILDDDHMRATHLIVSYLRLVTGAVEAIRRDGKTYFHVKEIAAMRRGVAELLATVQRIKGEGDFTAARDLVERFAIKIDPALRDEIVGRASQAGIPSYVALVMPDLVPVRDADGEVIDARVEYTSDLTLQMLKYSGKLPLETGTPTATSSSRPL